jgi:hypothetical protein
MTEIKITLQDLIALVRPGETLTGASHHLIGQWVVCRCHLSGMWLGRLTAHHGDHTVLADATRAWSWTTVAGTGAAGLAVHGLKTGKIERSPLVEIGERPIEIHVATDDARAAWDKVQP